MLSQKLQIPAILAIVTLVFSTGSEAAQKQPFRLEKALDLPTWLNLSGTHRLRYETLDSQLRVTREGSDQIFVMRTTLKAELGRGPLKLVGELMDSRAEMNDAGSPIGSSIVNTVEPLQLYTTWHVDDLIKAGSRARLRVGRFTMDVGSRRFVARNRYRNTINAFTGIDWQWKSNNNFEWRAFYTLPVIRLPRTRDELMDNDHEVDETDSDIAFWGLHLATRLSWGDKGEFFYFGLDEEDSLSFLTRNRELSTVGIRLYRPARVSKFDYQIESAFQFGDSSFSTQPNAPLLDHSAHFQHIELGYTFDAPWRPRLVAQYDYASGDDHPTDDDTERFDTLFGARRFDFGPTGIHGPFARANLNSAGLRLQLRPKPGITTFIAHRAYWLASDRDTWTTTGLRDSDGDIGSYLGHQIEIRLRWDLRPNNIRFESGMAHLFAGEFRDDAPLSNDQGDANYFYSQISFKF